MEEKFMMMELERLEELRSRMMMDYETPPLDFIG